MGLTSGMGLLLLKEETRERRSLPPPHPHCHVRAQVRETAANHEGSPTSNQTANTLMLDFQPPEL